MSSEQLHDTLMIAVEDARLAGSPVAGQQVSDREQIVQTALKRWSTFARRNRKVVEGDPLERRIEDLAKGLRDRVERRPSLTGPLMSDYRWLARKLAGILVEADGAVGGGQPDSHDSR
jgi:hypothetical protein